MKKRIFRVDPSPLSAEAGEIDVPAVLPQSNADVDTTVDSGNVASGVLPDSSMGHGDGSVQDSGKHDTDHDDVGAEAKRLHFSGYESLPHGSSNSC